MNHDRQGGQALRQIRLQLGLTLRDLDRQSRAVAEKLGDPRYCLPVSRLSELESGQVTPGLHKLLTLAVLYDRPILELIALFGLDVHKQENFAALQAELPTHPADLSSPPRGQWLPVRLDPSFNPQRNAMINRYIQEWQEVPPEVLAQLRLDQHLYLRIGRADTLLHPLLRPGSLVKVDPGLTEVVNSGWTGEHDRPLYVLSTHRGYRCGWCRREGKRLLLVPHPSSNSSGETFYLDRDVEVVGQVVAIWTTLGPERE